MFNAKYKLKLNLNYSFLETNTGGPRYMQSFYLRFHVYATQNWPFFWNPPLIYTHPWSFYMLFRYMLAYFFSPYLSHITRDTCIHNQSVVSDRDPG